jgi:hypothetical protein
LFNYNEYESLSKNQVSKKKWKKILGIILVVFSFLLYFVILPVPFTPFPVHVKGIIFIVLVIIKDVCLGIGIIILGKEYLGKYLKYLHIWDWLKNKYQKW